MIDAGNVVPIIQGHGSQRPPSCPSCRPCRSSTLPPSKIAALHLVRAVVPYGGKVVPVVPVPIDAGNVVPVVPALATAAVLLPMIDAGNVVPIIDLAARSGPVADRRREGGADHPGPRLATAAVVPRLDSRERRADHRPGCAVPVPAVSIIDLAAVLPCCRSSTLPRSCPVADRRREGGARRARCFPDSGNDWSCK